MKLFKKKLQIVFVLFLSVIFVHCSSGVDFDDIDDLKLTAPNTYDIKFTKAGSEPIHYKGSLPDEDDSYSSLTEGVDGESANIRLLSLYMDDGPLTITGMFFLDKNGNPYSFDKSSNEGVGSSLVFTESSKSKNLASKSGTLSISKFKIHRTVSSEIAKVHVVSYVLDIKGDFVVTGSGEEGNETYSATGKIVMSPYR